MKKNKILLVGGSWNLEGGKASGLVKKMHNYMEDIHDVTFYNGGNYNDLKAILETSIDYEIVFWMAYVPNDLPKVRYVKTINPHAIVIGSKRNDNKYSFVEILNRALEQRNNLTIQFTKDNSSFEFLAFDPLGTVWYKGMDLIKLMDNLFDRISFILKTKREHTYSIDKTIEIPNNENFFKYVRNASEIFQETIEHAPGVTRFLGNGSFREDNTGIIYVTERDVDKMYIDKEHFVAAYLEKDKVYYYGTAKPSKDTVIQTRLYQMLPNIKYMIHSHCYVEDAPFTNTPVPCGAIDEIKEILEVIKNNYNNDMNLEFYKFNLKGHGCIVMSDSIDKLEQIKYKTRHLPENLKEEK